MRRREQVFEKKMFHELSFLKFFCDTQFTRLVHLCYFVQNSFFFQHVTGRLCFSARFAQSDDVNYMNFRPLYHGKHLNIIFSNFIFTPLNHNLHVQKTHSNSDFINSMIYFVNAIIFKMLSENQRKYEKKNNKKKRK